MPFLFNQEFTKFQNDNFSSFYDLNYELELAPRVDIYKTMLQFSEKKANSSLYFADIIVFIGFSPTRE